MKLEQWWLGLGLIAQALFFMRFFIQWLASERAGRSIVPMAFWYFSLSGSVLLLAYALHRKDPVFVLGQSMGSLIYVRNIMLVKRGRSAAA